ncbi:MAG: NUDIX domain-containing protein [Candidatus Bipolaricaulota bacterium]|nr:NUDIX domain-containing protein [Candidatus Bipolaricaulota bacterium]
MDTKSTSHSPDGEERAAGFVVFREAGGGRVYLILLHRDGGHWGFPKGRIEAGESQLEAALREIGEETGISDVTSVPGFAVRSRYRVVRGGRRLEKTVDYFLGQTDVTLVRLSNEHDEAEWLDLDRARAKLTHAESRRVLDEADAFLEARRPEGSGAHEAEE